MKKLQNRIKEVRLKQGLSQKKLADLIGTSQQQIDLLEKSERKISIEWLEKLAKGLNADPISLLPEQWDNRQTGMVDKNLLEDIITAISDILSENSLSASEKARLVVILYDEYANLPDKNRQEKIIEFSRLYLKTKTA